MQRWYTGRGGQPDGRLRRAEDQRAGREHGWTIWVAGAHPAPFSHKAARHAARGSANSASTREDLLLSSGAPPRVIFYTQAEVKD